jgi:thymidylate kinase
MMTLELINFLVGALNRENIRYCHWKSNFSLAETLSGETDLDLLIDRKSLSRVLIILLNIGFKAARPKSSAEPDCIFHYYGVDIPTGQLIHVHLFSSVLTGESFVKTHLLPFEQMLLENTSTIGAMNVPSANVELIVFVLRTFIKYGSLLDVLVLAGKDKALREELTWLQQKGELAESLALLNRYLPVIDDTLFLLCLNTLKEDTSLLKRILLAYKIRRRLRMYAKYNLLGLASAYSQFLSGRLQRLLGQRCKDKVLKTGGAVIAFVGAEATGKSTLVGETEKWLAQSFSTRVIHAGKPPSTLVTAAFNATLPLLRRIFPRWRTTRQDSGLTEQDFSSPVSKGWGELLYAIRSVSLAWDRRQLLIQARYHASNGDIVICDRYPSENIGTMDSPRLQEKDELEGHQGTLYNLLARLERHFYEEIPPPDVVLKLRVSMETAKRRNRDRIKLDKESDSYLESRHRQCQDWCLAGTKYIYEINTEQSLKDTILSVKRQIWETI